MHPRGNPLRVAGGPLRTAQPIIGREGAAEHEILERQEHAGDLHVLLEQLELHSRRIEELYAHQRATRLTQYRESGYAASNSRIDLGPQTQDQFRVTYISAYAGTAATLFLKGSTYATTLAVPIPATTLVNIVLGDGDTGGIVLERHDTRYLATNDNSSQLLMCVLAGVTLSDTYLS